MKSSILIAATLLLSLSPCHAQTPAAPPAASKPATVQPENREVVIRVTIISLSNVEALQFSATEDLSGKASEALQSLEALVAQRQAQVVGNLAVTTKTGQRALSGSGKNSLEVEPSVSSDGKVADLNIVINDSDHKLTTSSSVTNGGVKFLGSVHSERDTTTYFFVRVAF